MTPRPGPQREHEVRASARDEAVAGREDDLLAEPEVLRQEGGDDDLDVGARRAEDVDQVDLGRAVGQMRLELQCEGIDTLELGLLRGSQRVAREALVLDLHARSFTAAAATS